jgi:hypothetical protein
MTTRIVVYAHHPKRPPPQKRTSVAVEEHA